jgi:GNAT superfamily N-acetyltransferase
MFAPSVKDVHSYVLNDGREIEIRSIRSDDGPRLQEHHDRLSPQSRYRRFMGSKPHLSEADTRYLTELDGCDHFALVATTRGPDTGAEEIVAVARFVRLPERPASAEFAIVVRDDFQRVGVARELLDRLAEAAVHRGVTHFRASMLADNVAIRRLLERLAVGEARVLRRGTVLELEVELPVRVVPVPSAAGPAPVIARPGPAMIAACAGS